MAGQGGVRRQNPEAPTQGRFARIGDERSRVERLLAEYEKGPYGDLRSKAGPTPDEALQDAYVNPQVFDRPEQFQPIFNPEANATGHDQYAEQAMLSSTALADKMMSEQPGLESYTLDPQFYNAMGWDPSQQYSYEQDINQGRTDTMGVDAQRAALGDYRDIIDQGGLTAIDRAAMMESQMRREQELRGNREAIMRNAAEQGRAGGVAQLLMQGQAAQGTANMRALDDARMQAAALGRRDAAIGAQAQLGGAMQSSQDAIDAFNTMGARNVQQRNIERQNQGVDTRYEDERQTGRDNVDMTNKFEMLNKSDAYGERGRLNERRDMAGVAIGTRTGYANHRKGQQAAADARTQAVVGNVLSGAGIAAGGAVGMTGALTGKKKKDDEE